MSSCCFCGSKLNRSISLRKIFSMHPIKDPLICIKCTNKFEKIDSVSACIGCGRKQATNEYCEDCMYWQEVSPELTPNHRAIFSYNTIAQEAMNRFKFQGDIYLADVFADILREKLSSYLKTHVIVPIPSSLRSYERRGFKPVDVLLDRAGITHQKILHHMGEGPLQSSKSRKERLETPQPFSIIGEKVLLSQKSILLVDDVYTTGRTIFHARNLLKDTVPTGSLSLFR